MLRLRLGWRGVLIVLAGCRARAAVATSEAVSPDAAAAVEGNAMELGLDTVGTLDLGGSSLEVTFMPADPAGYAATSESCKHVPSAAPCVSMIPPLQARHCP